MLGAGVALGILLAAAGALTPTTRSFSGTVVARVNGKAITSHDLQVALERRASNEGRSAITPEERQEVMNFLIDQELLVQRGVAIGLLESDRTVRKAVAMAAIDAIVAEVLKKEPTEEESRAFYESHKEVFTIPARVHVQHISFGGNGDLTRALAQAEQAFAAIVRGMSFAAAREQYGDKDSILVPDTLVPLQVLRSHLGPTLAEAVLTMTRGAISPPLLSPSGYHLFRVVELRPEQVRPYQAVEQEVRAEYFRRKRDEALQQHLDDLHQRATIVLSPEAPSETEIETETEK
jgi:parvulin-like peptidyl-prolyl isomerase